MANNYAQATVEPSEIPSKYIDDDTQSILEKAGFTVEHYGNNTAYIYSEYWISDEQLAVKTLQKILKAMEKDKIKKPYFEISIAFTCDKMRPGEFGGAAYFITSKKCTVDSTYNFLERQRKLHKKNK